MSRRKHIHLLIIIIAVCILPVWSSAADELVSVVIDAAPAQSLSPLEFTNTNDPTIHDELKQTQREETSVAQGTTSDTLSSDDGTTDRTPAAVDVAVAPSQSPTSRVWTPIPARITDDLMPHLFEFSPSPIHTLVSDPTFPPSSVTPTSLTTLVIRSSRRVTSVGMWRPELEIEKIHPMRRREWEIKHGVVEGEKPIITPPTHAPTVITSTLNLAVTALYRDRPGIDVYRGIQLHVLPGPSFHRGSMSALSESFGPSSIGFERAFYNLHDHRLYDHSNVGDDGSEEDDGRIRFQTDPSPDIAASHFPGFGPVNQLRTMSGQQNENWIMYRSGHIDEPTGKIITNTIIQAMQTHVWYDPSIAKAHFASRAADDSSDSHESRRLNTPGVTIRMTIDFQIKPMIHGNRFVGRRLTPIQAADMAAVESMLDPDRPIRYARVVDYRMYQQHKFLFLGVAYDDGFIRIFGRNGTLRNEVHTRNSTILHLTMSNWGSGTSTPGNGGGSREQNVGLNGAQNGNQLLAYVTPNGIGIVKMARIHPEVDQFCRWSSDDSSTLGPSHGADVRAIAFDANSQSILYLALDTSIVVLHTRLGWHAGRGRYDSDGRRLVEPGGNRCRYAHQLPNRIDDDTTTVTLSRARRIELMTLRGIMFLAAHDDSMGVTTLVTFNTSRINEIPKSNGIEFINKRHIEHHRHPRRTSSNDDSSEHDQRAELAHLIGDRIELLLVGSISSCIDTGRCTDSTLSTSNTNPQAVNVDASAGDVDPSIRVFQLFLPIRTDTGSSSWLTFSRAPLFILGLIGVFGWQYIKNQRRRRAERDGDGGGEMDEMGMEEMIRLASGGVEGGAGSFAASNTDPFDSRAFMADFERWQSGRGRGSGRGGMRRANGSNYMDELASDRNRARALPSRRRRPAPGVELDTSVRNLARSIDAQRVGMDQRTASIESQRVWMRRMLDSMDRTIDDDQPSGSNQMNHSTSRKRRTNTATSNNDQTDTYPVDETIDTREDISFYGESYETDDDQPQLDDQEVDSYVDEQHDYRDSALDADADGDADVDGDGPTFDGSYDSYEYHHSDYTAVVDDNLGDSHGTNSTYPIDEITYDEYEVDDDGIVEDDDDAADDADDGDGDGDGDGDDMAYDEYLDSCGSGLDCDPQDSLNDDGDDGGDADGDIDCADDTCDIDQD